MISPVERPRGVIQLIIYRLFLAFFGRSTQSWSHSKCTGIKRFIKTMKLITTEWICIDTTSAHFVLATVWLVLVARIVSMGYTLRAFYANSIETPLKGNEVIRFGISVCRICLIQQRQKRKCCRECHSPLMMGAEPHAYTSQRKRIKRST